METSDLLSTLVANYTNDTHVVKYRVRCQDGQFDTQYSFQLSGTLTIDEFETHIQNLNTSLRSLKRIYYYFFVLYIASSLVFFGSLFYEFYIVPTIALMVMIFAIVGCLLSIGYDRKKWEKHIKDTLAEWNRQSRQKGVNFWLEKYGDRHPYTYSLVIEHGPKSTV